MRRAAGPVILGVAILVVATHVAGDVAVGAWTWGVDAYAFLPAAVLLVATLALAAVAVVCVLPGLARRSHPRADTESRIHSGLGLAAAMVAAGAVFWLARSRALFLGDGLAIVGEPGGGWSLHPLEPLAAMAMQLSQHVFAHGPFADPGARVDAAWRAAAIVSVVAGVAFVPVAIGIAREFTRAAEPADGAGARGATVAIALTLLVQGYIVLFCGYVEDYALATFGLGLYVLAALRWLRGRGSLLACGLALALAVGIHLAAAACIPSFVVLAVAGVAPVETRKRTLRDLAVLGAVLLLVLVALAAAGFDLPHRLMATSLDVLRGDRSFRPGYRGSLEHLRDFLNVEALAGPLAAWLFVPAALLAVAGTKRGEPRVLFLLVCGGTVLLASALAGDSNLGYARNWDLLAPYGMVLTVCGLGLLLSGALGTLPRWGLAILLSVSLYHTAPWIALNASLDRSLERFMTLPLGLGRVESTVAYWHALSGETGEAERWYMKSLDENPGNRRAYLGLAAIFRTQGDGARECTALREAVRLRPSDDRARWWLVDALIRSHQWSEAEGEVASFRARFPDDGSFSLAQAIVLGLSGRTDEARAAHAESVKRLAGDSEWEAKATEVGAALGDGPRLAALWTRLYAVHEPREGASR